jgi:hypothetical protein
LTQEAADEREVLNADAVGEEPEMANAGEGDREGVEEESAEELVGMKNHDFGVAGIAVIFPAEGNMVIGDLGQTVVGNGDAVGVSAQITKDMVRPSEGGFGVDDPVGGAEAVDKRSEGLGIGESDQTAVEREFPLFVESQDLLQKHATNEPGQNADREEEVGRGVDSAGTIDGESAGGDEAVDVGMKVPAMATDDVRQFPRGGRRRGLRNDRR